MKFTKHTFLMLGIASLVSICNIDSAVAKYCSNNNPAPAGKYCYTNVVYSCKDGCYCVGGGYEAAGFLSCDAKGRKLKFGTREKDDGFVGVYLCPEGFTHSATDSKTIEECFYQSDKGPVYHKYVTCEAGEYLPKDSNKCEKCSGKKDMMDDEYCPGVTSRLPSKEKDEGIKTCDSPKIVSEDKAQCSEPPVASECSAGNYLPANGRKCESCKDKYKDGFVCPGYNEKKDYPEHAGQIVNYDRGLTKCRIDERVNTDTQKCEQCPNGQERNSEKPEQCTDIPQIELASGYYLPANVKEQAVCINDKTKYCPGGTVKQLSKSDQGIYDCPYGSEQNDKRDGCRIELTQYQMKFGIKRDGRNALVRCWAKTNDEEYKRCVFQKD